MTFEPKDPPPFNSSLYERYPGIHKLLCSMDHWYIYYTVSGSWSIGRDDNADRSYISEQRQAIVDEILSDPPLAEMKMSQRRYSIDLYPSDAELSYLILKYVGDDVTRI